MYGLQVGELYKNDFIWCINSYSGDQYLNIVYVADIKSDCIQKFHIMLLHVLQ